MSDSATPQQTIPVVDLETGEHNSVLPNDLPQALKNGFRQATPDELHEADLKQQYGTGFGNEAKAFTEEALGQASFGLSRELENKFGFTTPEAQAARQKYNPGSSALGGVAGIGAAVFAPEIGAVDEGVNVLSHALNPIKAVSKAGEAVADAASPLAAKAAGIIANPETSPVINRILSQTGASALGSSVEGAAYGLGQSISEDALGDPSLNGEKILSNVGYGALFGGALGGLLKAGEVGIPASLDKAKDSLSKLMTSSDGEVGSLGQGFAKLSSFVSGKPENEILDAIKDRSLSLISPEERMEGAKDLVNHLSDHVDQMNKLTKDVFGDIRPEETERALASVDPLVAHQEAASTVTKINDAIKQMDDRPSYYPRMIRDKLEDIRSDFEKDIAEAKTANEVYQSINDLKQRLDTKIKFGKIPGPEYQDSISLLKGIRGDIKSSLENESVWGEAGARQSAFNDAFSSFKNAQNEFNKNFGKKFITKSGSVSYRLDPSKVENFIKASGGLKGELRQEALNNYLESSKGFIGEAQKSYEALPGKVFDKQAAIDLIDKNAKIAKKAEQQAQYNKLLGSLGAGAHNAPLFEGGALTAGVFGHPAVGAALEGWNLLKSPGLAIQRLAKIERMAQKSSDSIAKASKAIFSSSTKAARPFVPKLGQQYAVNNTGKSELIAKINDLNSNPVKMIDQLSEHTKDLYAVAPKTSGAVQQAAVRATQFLASKAPNTQPLSPLSEPLKPSPAEIAKFNRYYQTVENPESILQSVANGTVTAEQIETLQTVYPSLFLHMQKHVTDHLTDEMSKGKKLPYSKKLSLSTFLGQDLVASLAQQNIAANQIAHATASNQGSESQMDQAMKTTQTGLGKLTQSNRAMTSMQSIAQGGDA